MDNTEETENIISVAETECLHGLGGDEQKLPYYWNRDNNDNAQSLPWHNMNLSYSTNSGIRLNACQSCYTSPYKMEKAEGRLRFIGDRHSYPNRIYSINSRFSNFIRKRMRMQLTDSSWTKHAILFAFLVCLFIPMSQCATFTASAGNHLKSHFTPDDNPQNIPHHHHSPHCSHVYPKPHEVIQFNPSLRLWRHIFLLHYWISGWFLGNHSLHNVSSI